MSHHKLATRVSIARSASLALALGLALAANVTAATGYGFIDSIAEFFGIETTQTSVLAEQPAEPDSAEPMAVFAACTFSSVTTGLWGTAGTWTTVSGTGCGTYPG